MLLFAPFILGWMTYMIIRYGIYNGSFLSKDEYGFFDRERYREGEEPVKLEKRRIDP